MKSVRLKVCTVASKLKLVYSSHHLQKLPQTLEFTIDCDVYTAHKYKYGTRHPYTCVVSYVRTELILEQNNHRLTRCEWNGREESKKEMRRVNIQSIKAKFNCTIGKQATFHANTNSYMSWHTRIHSYAIQGVPITLLCIWLYPMYVYRETLRHSTSASFVFYRTK